MHTRMNESGAALILLIGITATLAILSSMLVFVIQNEQRATASSRSSKQSLYASEAALDAGVQLAKVGHTMSTTAEWLTPTELAAAFAGQFPADAVVTYKVYDNLTPVNETVKWDQGGPTAANTPAGMMWVEATCEY
jgi:Tfp pilus assembly protein PilX